MKSAALGLLLVIVGCPIAVQAQSAGQVIERQDGSVRCRTAWSHVANPHPTQRLDVRIVATSAPQ